MNLTKMKFEAIFSMAGFLSICTCAPIYQPQIGIIASNSNEVLRINGLTLASLGLGQAQGTPFFSPYLIQQQPPQVLNFNPAMQGFFPPQINQLNPAQLPPLQQEQPIPGFGPNNGIPAQNPPPGFPFFLTNLYPLRNTPVRLIPNQNAGPNIQGQATMQPVQPMQPIQPIQNRVKAVDPMVTSAPDYRGDRPGPGTVEGHPGFPLFEP
ncbi:amelogenin, X isoform isoform X1 [Rhinichthys klamathensis goyatoka]|uniref:amelogenin, X isoform isoform X1 n=1 Tax=Rhinichthys klamathensis goyatoka TaxID=3034132 RepID=UPI0024B55B61|nr:amelogenin, X isoform isoform X1 [Rhinichthys klamathensis goyatoka]